MMMMLSDALCNLESVVDRQQKRYLWDENVNYTIHCTQGCLDSLLIYLPVDLTVFQPAKSLVL